MNVQHVFNDKLYLLTNHVVAGNPLFHESYYGNRFLAKIDDYLSPLCEIVSRAVIGTEFQILVRIRDRKSFIRYYRASRKKRNRSYKKVPHSGYIFSQAMANLQSSAAIHFNRREKRTGALFAKRFRKIFIQNEKELQECVSRILSREKIHEYDELWRVDQNGPYFMRRFVKEGGEKSFRSEDVLGGKSNGSRNGREFLKQILADLQGQLFYPVLKRVSDKELKRYLEIRHSISIKT